jgi:primosomal protein N'
LTRPLLSPERIALARWMSAHYLAPLFDCVSLMLPPGSKQRPLTLLTPLATVDEIPTLGLTDKQARALTYIIERGEAQADELKRDLGLTNVPGVVSALLRRGFVQRTYRLARPSASRKVVRMLRLASGEEAARRRAAELR